MTQNSKDPHVPTLGASSRKTSMLQARPRFTGLSRSAVALFQLGTYRAHMAAALMIVAVSLLYQTGAEALEQSSKKVLYLDAPSVSVPQAQKAGETAWGYAGPDSNVDDSVLAWVDVKPTPLEARKAFASVTDPSGQPPGGVSYDDAMAAGDAMVAQIGGDSPATEDNGRMMSSQRRTRSGQSSETARRQPRPPCQAAQSSSRLQPPGRTPEQRAPTRSSPNMLPPTARLPRISACRRRWPRSTRRSLPRSNPRSNR